MVWILLKILHSSGAKSWWSSDPYQRIPNPFSSYLIWTEKTDSGYDGKIHVWRRREKKKKTWQTSDCALRLSQEYRLQTKLSRSAAFLTLVCVYVYAMGIRYSLSADAKRCLAHAHASCDPAASFRHSLEEGVGSESLARCRSAVCLKSSVDTPENYSVLNTPILLPPPGKAERSIWI